MIQQRFTIPTEFPGLNEVIAESKRHWSKYAVMKRKYTALISILARKDLVPIPHDSLVFISFDWYCKNRRRDPDNIASAKKFIIDGLVKAGIIPDDSWKWIAGFTDRFHVDKNHPRVIVTLQVV